ncbi:MAG: hypothetical protein IPO94_12450 [Saprospiraceae bacterium]|nr:hypothetical protein [Saprospiraceae bacterium]
MGKVFISIEGESSIIEELNQLIESKDIQKSSPVQKESLADPLDSPIGADEVKSIIEVITLILEFGTGIITFGLTVKKTLAEYPGKKLVLRNPNSGKKIGEITENTSEEEIKNMLK